MESASKERSSAVSYVAVAVLAVSSYAVARYLNTPWTLVTWLFLFVLCILAVHGITCETLVKRRRLSATILVFSLAFDVALILGSHIIIGDMGVYGGLSNENYISNYHARDAFSFALMLPALFTLFIAPALRCRETSSVPTSFSTLQGHSLGNLGARRVLLFSAIIFVGWLPYIVIYWPGFIFGDSLVSLNQVYGYASLSNHHPVAYTAYLGFWVKLANACGLSATLGIGLSSIVQSILLSLTFGYLCRWIAVRGGA